MRLLRVVRLPFARDARRGAVTVEATLLLPLFLIFWFGIVDWGIAFWIHETVVFRANAAVRWAVVNTYDAAKIKSKFLYDDPNATGTSTWFSMTDPNVTVQLLGLESTNDKRVVMTVKNYQWMHFTPFFSGRYFGRDVVVTLPVEDLRDGY
jgi:TadE-like protein